MWGQGPTHSSHKAFPDHAPARPASRARAQNSTRTLLGIFGGRWCVRLHFSSRPNPRAPPTPSARTPLDFQNGDDLCEETPLDLSNNNNNNKIRWDFRARERLRAYHHTTVVGRGLKSAEPSLGARCSSAVKASNSGLFGEEEKRHNEKIPWKMKNETQRKIFQMKNET